MPNYILLAIPGFFLLIGIELLVGYLQHKKLYRFNDAITNLNIGIGSQAFGIVSKAFIFGIYMFVQERWGIWTIEASIPAFIACLLLFDFLFYWAHRWGHEVNFFWGAHVVHHQSEEYNLSVALRQPWFHNMIAFFIFLPIPFLGFDPAVFLAAASIHTLYQFWIHTKTVGKLWAPIEFLFNTPSHHRVHHGRDPKYIDKNHGGVLIIWDRLFGTFQVEEEEPTYGITTQLSSWNPTWANIHYYVDMVKFAAKMKTWKERLYLIFAKPGWLPEYMGGFQHVQPVDQKRHKNFDTRTTLALNLYVLFQFVVLALGIVAYLMHFDALSQGYRMLFLVLIVLSTMICGAIFENKRWVIVAEYLRLAVAIVGVNVLYYSYYIDWFGIMLTTTIIGFVVCCVWFTLSWLFNKEMLNKKLLPALSER